MRYGYIVFCLFSQLVFAQQLPPRKAILSQLQLANQYFMQKWPDPGKPTFTNKERPSNLWTRAVYYEADGAVWDRPAASIL